MEVTDGIAAPPSLFRFRITVQTVDDPPTIAPIPTQSATEGTPFDLDLATFVTDPDTAASRPQIRGDGRRCRPAPLSSAGRLSGTPPFGTASALTRFASSSKMPRTTVTGQFSPSVLPAGRVDLGVTLSATPSPAPLDAATTWNITVDQPLAGYRRGRRVANGAVPRQRAVPFRRADDAGLHGHTVRQSNHAHVARSARWPAAPPIPSR